MLHTDTRTWSVTVPALDRPGVIARPPRLYQGFLALGVGLHYIVPLPALPGGVTAGARSVAAAALVTLGVALMVAAVRQFRAAGTNVETFKPATALVTDGVFRVSRNPMYLSLSLIYVGIGVALDSLWILALFVPLIVLMRHGVIAREERYLERKFGDHYLRYQASVRRWL